MMVSALSLPLSGSKYTRLLKQGLEGHTVEIVAVSWTAKPCGVSSRVMILSVPPDLGVWLSAGRTARAPATSATASSTATTGRDDRRIRESSSGCRSAQQGLGSLHQRLGQ